MKIKINKNEIISKFLTPISKITDKCIINLQPDSIFALTNTDDGSIILYANLKVLTQLPENNKVILNIPDVKRLNRIFDCLNSDILDIEVNTNNLKYDTDDIKFVYHLLDDGIIQKSVISIDKISKLTFDCVFDLTSAKYNEILKGSTITTDSNKLYFYTKDNKVFAELTDKATQNLDSITFNIAETYVGSEIKQVLPISLEIFRLFSGLKADKIVVKINTKLKVLMFEISDSVVTLKYIVSALIK